MNKTVMIVVMTLLVMVACRGGQVVVSQYYLLELPPFDEAMPSGAFQTLPGICEVAEVKVAPAFASHQIAVREDTHQIRYFSFNEWAVRPPLAFTGLLLDFLQDRQVFEEVTHGRHALPSKYLIETEITHLEMDVGRPLVYARLNLTISLYDTATGDRLVSHQADRSEPLSAQDLNEFASVTSQLFAEELTKFSMSVSEKLSMLTK